MAYRNLGDSKIVKAAKRIANIISAVPPIAMRKYLHPMFFERVQFVSVTEQDRLPRRGQATSVA